MKILLANIGNRNITYKGKMYFSSVGDTKEISFREWTKALLDNYEEVRDELDINIINPLIEGKDIPQIIYLYYSDQSKMNTKSNQDTVHEAALMKNILCDKYNYEEGQIHLEHVNAKVIDNGALLKYYRKSLTYIKRKNPNANLQICDAGGTAQQKYALKIMAEFILDKNKYEIKYTEGNRLTTDVNVDEYRKVISAEQAIKLIHQGEYRAAAMLLDYDHIIRFNNLSKKEWKKKIFAHVFYRFVGNHREALLNIEGLTIQNKILKDYQSQVDPFETELPYDHKDKIILADLLQKVLFYVGIKKYSQAILSFSQFYEKFFMLFMELHFDKKIYGNSNYQSEDQQEKFDTFITNNISLPKNHRISYKSLATQIVIARSSEIKAIKNLAELLAPYIQFTGEGKYSSSMLLNTLRNKVAHEGLYIEEAKIHSELNYIPEVIEKTVKILNPKRNNVFQSLNELLENNLR